MQSVARWSQQESVKAAVLVVYCFKDSSWSFGEACMFYICKSQTQIFGQPKARNRFCFKIETKPRALYFLHD